MIFSASADFDHGGYVLAAGVEHAEAGPWAKTSA